MTKSKLSLRNSAKRALLFNILIFTCLFLGCSSSTAPTYLKENIAQTIQDICKKEYGFDLKVRLVGETLWLYLPVQDIFTARDLKDKPDKYLEKFNIEENKNVLENGKLKLEYIIKETPEKEKYQEYNYNKKVAEQTNNVIMVLRRVVLSLNRSKGEEPKYYCLVVADIKNGFQIKQVMYYTDLRKVSYGLISTGEYQHRTTQDLSVEPKAIDDKEGLYLDYKNISAGDFIVAQIEHRIKLKFGKPEVERNADIDKEILKIVVYTIKTYGFKDFENVELNNLATGNKASLNAAAIWAKTTE
jgi:hypothetical protein